MLIGLADNSTSNKPYIWLLKLKIRFLSGYLDSQLTVVYEWDNCSSVCSWLPLNWKVEDSDHYKSDIPHESIPFKKKFSVFLFY